MEETVYVLDRIEENAAVLIADCDQRVFTVDLHLLPDGAAEGDVLRESTGDGASVYRIDTAETTRRRADASARLRALFQRGKPKA